MKVKIHLPEFLRMGTLPIVLIVLMAIAFVVAMVRYAFGIGAISDLSNSYPWGFWISFDIFTGIAITSGAFTLAAVVCIFGNETFRPLLMPSILTALLGYVMEVFALFVDLGKPERIWYMLVYQNQTSTMLVIGMCVMIYLVILLALFAPVVFDRFQLTKYAELFRRFVKPLVILAVVTSTVHQSSLGSLLLIQPAKLHPLWWTPILPILFFTSAISVGLSMIILESSLSSRYFQRGLETHLLAKLAKALPIALGVYLVIKVADLAIAGDFGYLFSSGLMSVLFWAEIFIGVLFPMVWFSIEKNRNSPSGLLTGAIVTLLGLILNRFNVSWFGITHPDPLFYMPSFMGHVDYFPTFPEVAVSIGIFSAGIMAFGLLAKYFPVFEAEGHEAHAAD